MSIAPVTNAVCEADGAITETCSICGHENITVIDKLGHDLKTVTVDATCEADGSETTTCSRCDYSDVKKLDKLGHDLKTVTVAATCEANGSITVSCSSCDYVESVTTLDKLGHDLKTVTVAATCEADGSETTTCSRCDYKEVTVLNKLSHDWDEGRVTIEPDYGITGQKTYSCLRCGDTRTEAIPALVGPVVVEDFNYRFTSSTSGNGSNVRGTLNFTFEFHFTDGSTQTRNATIANIAEGRHPEQTYYYRFDNDDARVKVNVTTVRSGGNLTFNVSAAMESILHFPPVAHVHNLRTVTVDATCETDGSITVTCSLCDFKEVTILPAVPCGVCDVCAGGPVIVPEIPAVVKILQDRSASILRTGLTSSELVLNGRTLSLALGGHNIVLSNNANNRNFSGTVRIVDDWYLTINISSNGSSVRTFTVEQR